MVFKNFIGHLRNKVYKALMPILDYEIGGITIKAVRGTIRKNTDQDDAWLRHLQGQSDIYFDIGCSIGYTSLMALTQKDMRCVLVDPSTEAITIAARNIIANSMSGNVSFYHAFVGNKLGIDVTFYSDGWEAASSMYSSHARTAASKGAKKKVNTVTVDFLCDYYQLTPDLVKIDVEGAELLVLEGAVNLASAQKTRFFIEMHRLEERSMKDSGQFVIDWCISQNYKAFYLTNHSLLANSESIASRGKCHLLLLPNEQEYPIGLSSIKRNSNLS